MVPQGQSVYIFQHILDGIELASSLKPWMWTWIVAELVNMGFHQDYLPQTEVQQDYRRKLYQAKEWYPCVEPRSIQNSKEMKPKKKISRAYPPRNNKYTQQRMYMESNKRKKASHIQKKTYQITVDFPMETLKREILE